MPLQIRRGTAAERNALSAPLVIGELLYTTDTGRLYIGDGTALGSVDIQGNPGQGGKGLSITGFTSEDAQDATATLFANGTHGNIVFTYDDGADALSATLVLDNYNGNIAIDGSVVASGSIQAAGFKGSIFADDSTLLVDAVSGSIPYSVITGVPTNVSSFTNDAGYITAAEAADGTITIDVNNTGDLQGNVFGDDSTLLVDAINSIIPASVVSGTFTGNVVGTVTGTLNGDVNGGSVSGTIITNSVNSADSSTITISSPLTVDSVTNITSALVVTDGGTFQSANSAEFPLSITAAHDDDLSTTFTVRRSRGSISSPTTLIDQDRIGSINFTGHDGSSFIPVASIQAKVGGTVSSGVIPGQLRFLLNDPVGSEIEAASINSFGGWTLYGRAVNATPLQIATAHSDASNASNFILNRSRGTVLSPTGVISGDPIFDILFTGNDGTSNRSAAQIRVTVNDTVSTGVVPGRFDFFTTSSSGTFASRLTIEDTKTTFNNIPVLPTYADDTAADAAIGGAGNRVNGMMFYNTALGAIRAVVGGSWTSL